MKRTLILATLFTMALTACGEAAAPAGESSTTTTAPSEPETTTPTSVPEPNGPDTVTIVLEGGCQMMGPNCPTYEVRPDGTFTLSRTGQGAPVVEASIDAAIAERLWSAVTSTDFGEMMAALGPGSCQACVDGVDTQVLIDFPDQTLVLDSTESDFDRSYEIFVALDEVLAALSSAAELPIETR